MQCNIKKFYELLTKSRKIFVKNSLNDYGSLPQTIRGKGEISTKEPSLGCIESFEQIELFIPPQGSIKAQNHLRWEFSQSSVKLFHLRQKNEKPVFLVKLFSKTSEVLHSEKKHQCETDGYDLKIYLKKNSFFLIWSVHGKKKKQRLQSFFC